MDNGNDVDVQEDGSVRRRPSLMAMLAAGALGAAVLGVGGMAYAQEATPAPGTDGSAVVEQECDEDETPAAEAPAETEATAAV